MEKVSVFDLPYLDREDNAMDLTLLSPDQIKFRELGFQKIEAMIPESLVDAVVCELRDRKFTSPLEYQFSNHLKALLLHVPLYQTISDYVGDDCALQNADPSEHSEQTLWHQDEHYNPKNLASWGMGAFICLEDMADTHSTVEFAVSSHKLGPQKHIETPLELDAKFQTALKDMALHTEEFIGKKGDVLLFHRDLFHRRVVGTREPLRLLAQYSSNSMRRELDRYEFLTGGWYFIHH